MKLMMLVLAVFCAAIPVVLVDTSVTEAINDLVLSTSRGYNMGVISIAVEQGE